MKIVSFDSFCNDWAQKLDARWPEEEQFCVYVSNPFCRKICKFCIYKSSVLSEDRYRRYYESYLPTLIRRLTPILSIRIPDTLYFGGGTASLMDADTMHTVFGAIPNLELIGYKCFEANPASLSKAKIDVLTEYKFTEISLGVQTFDEAVLNSQGREFASVQDIAGLVSYAARQGLFVNVDLLTNYESDDEENAARLKSDLMLVAQQVNPGKLTIYPRYQTYYKADKAHRIQQIKTLRNCIRSFCEQSQYRINPELVRVDTDDAILSYGATDYHVYNMNAEVHAPRTRYNCSAPGYLQKPQNVIGIGGYAKQIPYSYIWNAKQWYMINHNWQPLLVEAPFNDSTLPEESIMMNRKT